MRRSAELEGVDDEAELVIGVLLAYAQDFEHPLLHCGLVDTYGAAAEFGAVEDKVVGIGAHLLEILLFVGVVEFEMLRLRRGERMVHCIEAAVLLAPFEEREVHNPERGEVERIAQAEAVAHLDAEHAQHGLRLSLLAAEQEHEVSGLCAGCLADGLQLLRGVELVHRGLEAAVGIAFYIYEALGAHLRTLHPFGEGVDLLAGVLGAARCGYGADVRAAVEDAEALSVHEFRHLVNLHSEAYVRLVGAVEVHSVVPAHARDRIGYLHIENLLEEGAHHSLEGVQHVLLLHEAHLAVDLGEFRLAVGPEVLVAEAAHYLEVAVVAGHHQQLLEGLRGLRQGVEGARVHPGRHHEVTRSLRSGLYEIRSLDFHEILGVEIVAYLVGNVVAQLEGPLQRGASEVQVAVLCTQVLAAVAVLLDGERRGHRPVEYFYGLEGYLDVARRDLAVLVLPFHYGAGGLYHKLPAQRGCAFLESGVCRALDHELGDSIAVAQVNECHSSQFAGLLYPAGQGHLAAGVFNAEFSASVCSVHIWLVIEFNSGFLAHGLQI